MRYPILLFDLDHTLFDTDASELTALRAALGHGGVSEPDRLLGTYREINHRLWERVERGELVATDVPVRRFEQLFDRVGIVADPDEIAEVFLDGLAIHGDLYPGAMAMLDEMTAEASLALVTNGLGRVQRARIDRLGLTDSFDAVAISGELGFAKPAEPIFDAVFEQLDWPDRSDVLMIGDSLTSDIAGGVAYGIATCWFDMGRRIRPPGTAASDHRIDDLAQIPILARTGRVDAACAAPSA